jgi:uncharacterized protein (TIGR02453 family)
MKKEIFPIITENYLQDLYRNNNKEWFAKNKSRFENEFLKPASDFVIELGNLIREIVPNIIAIPKIDQSIFRLHRDMRFSKDKKPYKTNLGIYIWEGDRPRMECSGFYFHIEPGNIFWGSGIYKFSADQQKKFREIVSSPENASQLENVLNDITINPAYSIGGSELKKTPRGYDHTYIYKKYFLHTGLYAYYEKNTISEFDEKSVLYYSIKLFRDFYPLHKWLMERVV